MAQRAVGTHKRSTSPSLGGPEKGSKEEAITKVIPILNIVPALKGFKSIGPSYPMHRYAAIDYLKCNQYNKFILINLKFKTKAMKNIFYGC